MCCQKTCNISLTAPHDALSNIIMQSRLLGRGGQPGTQVVHPSRKSEMGLTSACTSHHPLPAQAPGGWPHNQPSEQSRTSSSRAEQRPLHCLQHQNTIPSRSMHHCSTWSSSLRMWLSGGLRSTPCLSVITPIGTASGKLSRTSPNVLPMSSGQHYMWCWIKVEKDQQIREC